MSTADSTRRACESLDAAPDDASLDDDLDAIETEGTDEIVEETGLDLTDASELDADNVPADEEFSRTNHAPD